jgi:cytosine/adenosine deaminase-related metal-dependent hydrolase
VIRYHARWVLPITRPPIEDGTVVEHGGRIVYVGDRAGAPAGDDHEFGESVLLPGLVNTHTHLELTAMRGILEGLPFPEWIARLRASRDEVLDAQSMLDSARWGIVEGLRAGITTFADTCSSGVAIQAMSEAGVRGLMYQEVFGPDPARCDAMISALRERLQSLRMYESALLRVGLSPHAPYTVSDALYIAAARLADVEEMPVAVHVAESEAESQLVVEGCGAFADSLRSRGIAVTARGRSPVAVLDAAGILGARTLLIHCMRVDAHDIELISRSRSAVAHCPISNANMGHGMAPLTTLLAANVRVGLGSDSVLSSNYMDILDEARMAALLQSASNTRADVLSASQALELATLGGARALGIAARVGSLEAGKDADLAVFSLEETPLATSPESALLFSPHPRRAMFVAVAGRVLVRDGNVLGEDADVRERVAATADALARWHLSSSTVQ